MDRATCVAAGSLAIALGAGAVSAEKTTGGGSFTITPLVLEGDLVPGVGAVTRIDNLAVNDLGQWVVEADTDHANLDADSVVLKNGVLAYREGDALALPVGASIGSFDSINIDNAGDTAWNLFLDGTASIFDDSGIFYNTELVIQEGAVAGASGFSPGTTYIGFFDVKNSNSNHFMSVLSVDDPAIATSVDRAIVVFEAPGMGFTQHVIAKEGDVLPGQVSAIADFGTGPHHSAFNDLNDIVVFVDLAGSTTTDGCVYLIEVDDSTPVVQAFVKLAQEGDPSPVVGRTWSSLASPELDLNNGNDYVFSGSLSGDPASNLLIVKNGAAFKQEGDAAPGAPAFQLTSFGTGPIEISQTGDVLWYGRWNDPNTSIDSGLHVNDTLIVQEGVTMMAGQVATTLRGIADGYHMSDSGQYVILEAVLADGTEGAFLVEFASCPADFDGDAVIDVLDLLALISHWGSCPPPPAACPWDLDQSGAVDVLDLLALLTDWGPCP